MATAWATAMPDVRYDQARLAIIALTGTEKFTPKICEIRDKIHSLIVNAEAQKRWMDDMVATGMIDAESAEKALRPVQPLLMEA